MQQPAFAFHPRARFLLRCLLAALGAVGLALYAPYPVEHPVLSLIDLWKPGLGQSVARGALGFALGWIWARYALARPGRRPLRYGLGLGGLFACTCVLGMELQRYGTLRLTWQSVGLNLLCFAGLWALSALLLLWAMARGGRWLRRGPFPGRGISLLGYQGLLLLCWLPVWLAYAPGLANYDILSHMQQCASQQYATLHPVLYTLVVQACLWAGEALGGSTTLAIALLCWLQMLLLSGALAYGLFHLQRMGVGRRSMGLAVLFLGLFPVFPLLAISTTKDVPYAALTLVVMVQLLRMFQQPGVFWATPRRWVGLLLAATLMGMLRYNGVASLGLLALCLLWAWRPGRARRKACHGSMPGDLRWRGRTMALLLSTLLMAYGGNQALNAATHAAPSFVTARDMASLPSQQLVRATLEMEHNSPEYQAAVRWYSGAGMLHNYRPRLADYTKRYLNVDQEDGWRSFALTWLQVGINHPKAYLEAFWEMNRGLWFIQDLSHANIYPEVFPLFGYLLNNQADCGEYVTPIQFHSKLPGLQAFLNGLTTENQYLKIPLVRMLFSVGAQCWLTVLLFAAALYRRDRPLCCAMGWLLCLLAVLAFAPAVLVRYTFPLFLGNVVGVLALGRAQEARS